MSDNVRIATSELALEAAEEFAGRELTNEETVSVHLLVEHALSGAKESAFIVKTTDGPKLVEGRRA